MDWHARTLVEVKEKLNTDIYSGLSEIEAQRRLAQNGENVFLEEDTTNLFSVIGDQFKSPLVFVLLVAGGATVFLAEYLDALVIAIALCINIIVGTVQEWRAGSAFQKLKESQEKYAFVLRGGRQKKIFARDLVVGDVIFVKAGSFVPADARIVESESFATNESALTGEWLEVRKEVVEVPADAPLVDRENMIWMGTAATTGSVKAVVVATGSDTEVGTIAKDLNGKESQTPLQKNMHSLAMLLTIIIAVILIFILVVGLMHGQTFHDMLLVSIAIAVAAMPEGLPAAVTVVLALGMEEVLKKKGLMRNLLAAETLGSTTVILTDKTGTLTKAQMQIAGIFTYTSISNKEESGEENGVLANNSDEHDVLAMATLTSDAFVEGYDDALSEWIVHGRPVEKAIVLASLETGIRKEKLLSSCTEIDAIPFESEKRFAASLYRFSKSKKQKIYFSGAPELLLEHATFVYKNGRKVKLGVKARQKLEKLQEEKSSQGMRMIAVAYKDTDIEKFSLRHKDDPSMLLDDVVFAGFMAIHDPLRSDVPQSIKEAHEAGTQVIMVTGDNPYTAKRIAVKAGISPANGKVLTGDEIAEYSDIELLDALHKVRVFARVLPNQKMRIVNILKRSGEVVAMTGDGINDAPALRRADIGVALGSGTEVAKEASDMVLLDNSFTVIVHAIEEGRRILDNLKKIVAYLLSTSFSEIFVVGSALVAGVPLPLLPAQILWTNIVEEGFMNFSFAFEPKEEDIMRRSPASARMKNILTRELRSIIIILSLITGIFLSCLYFILLKTDLSLEEVRTVMFMLLSIDSIFFTFSLKNLHKPVWHIKIFSNKYLIFALGASITTLVLAVTVPFLQKLLSLAPVSAFDFMLVVLAGVFNLTMIEILKWFYFTKNKKSARE